MYTQVSHVVSIVVLALRLNATKSAVGISLKTQELYLIVFVSRYADLFSHFYSYYNTLTVTFYASNYNRPLILAALIKAAGPNAAALVTTHRGLSHDEALQVVPDYWSDLQIASMCGHAECVRVLLSAGAGLGIDDCNPLGLTALECAISCSQRHIYPMLLAAGATIPSNADDINNDESGDTAYLRKVAAAGGFPAYEKAHRQVLATKFAAKAFPRLPTDVAAHFVAFAFHVGYY